MTRAHLDPATLELGLRAVKAVAMADEAFEERERRLMVAAARALRAPGSEPIDVDALEVVEPEELAAAISDPLTRERIVQAQLIMALIDGEVADSEVAVVRRFAKALEVDEPRIKNLRQLMHHHHTILRLDLSRHSRMAFDAARHAYEHAGLRGVYKTLAPLMAKTLGRDDALAARYHALGELGPETFGHQYWAHMTARGFTFPGEKGGFPEEFIKHDCCHVLGGFDTDPAGECEVVAFICGFMRADPFWYLFMITVHMHLGIETFPGNPLGDGAFDPDRVLAALDKGLRVREDLYVPGFDWWALFPRPIDEVRAQYGISPPGHAVA